MVVLYCWLQTIQIVQSRTRFRQNPCQHSHASSQGHISVDAVRVLIRTGSITGVHVINDFIPFICDSCEYVKMTRKKIHKE